MPLERNLNPYVSSQWRTLFPKTELYKKIKSNFNFEHVIYNYKEMNFLKAALNPTVYAIPRNVLREHQILDALPYYYIQWILEKNPAVILDIGCGTNPFDVAIPNIIGIDDQSCPPTVSPVAIKCQFNSEFVSMHQQMSDAVISVNGIHFSPMWNIRTRLLEVAQLLRPGGRAFVSTNAETWLGSTPTEETQNKFGKYPELNDILDYMHNQVLSTNLKFLVSDWPVYDITEHGPIRDDLNGNIRLVFEVDN